MKPVCSTVLLAALAFSLGACKADDTQGTQLEKPAAGPLVVAAKSGLNLRARPDRLAPVVIALPSAARVTPTGKTGPAETIDKTGGTWIEVSYQGKTGWAFDAFLKSAQAGPAPSAEEPQAVPGKPVAPAAGSGPANAEAFAAAVLLELRNLRPLTPFLDPDGTWLSTCFMPPVGQPEIKRLGRFAPEALLARQELREVLPALSDSFRRPENAPPEIDGMRVRLTGFSGYYGIEFRLARRGTGLVATNLEVWQESP
jgi:hypothetical protein